MAYAMSTEKGLGAQPTMTPRASAALRGTLPKRACEPLHREINCKLPPCPVKQHQRRRLPLAFSLYCLACERSLITHHARALTHHAPPAASAHPSRATRALTDRGRGEHRCALGTRKVPYIYNNSALPYLTALVSMKGLGSRAWAYAMKALHSTLPMR
eukprot:1712980-Rhodomonas_salina.2